MTNDEYYAKAFVFIIVNPSEFRPGFADWLWLNIDIQRAFDAEAIAVAVSGRAHYSAYTIAEYLRHHTNLKSKGTNDYKLPNNWRSNMVRMFAFMYPQYEYLFQFNELKNHG